MMSENSDHRHSVPVVSALGWASMKSLILGVLLLAPTGLYAQQQQSEKPETQSEQTKEKQPSLVDLAKQQRERRTQSSEAVRVIRNADLRTMGGARVSTGIPPKPAEKSPDAAESSETGEETKDVVKEGPEDTQFWANAFREAKTALETAVNQRMVLELRMNNLRNAYLNTSDGTTREQIQSELAQTYTGVGQAREDEKAAREAIRQLERQASRVGIPPGKVRELVGELPESKSFYEGVPESNEGGPES